jgi:hypothetical protein
MGMEYYIILKSFPRAESPGHRKLLHRFFFSDFCHLFLLASWESLQALHTGTVPSSARQHLHLFPRPSLISRALLHTPAATAAGNLRSPANPSPVLSPPSSVRYPTIQPLPPLGDQKKPQWRRLGLGTVPPPTQVGARMCISISICSRLCPLNADPMS